MAEKGTLAPPIYLKGFIMSSLARLKYVDIFGKRFYDGSCFSYRPAPLDSSLESYCNEYGLYHVYCYPTGTCRFISTRGLNQGIREPPKIKKTWEFSGKARRRYFHFMLSLNVPSELIPFWVVFTFPREFRLNIDLRLDNYKLIIKRFFQRLSRMGIDTIAKTEFHKDFYPHLHCILIGSREVLKNGEYSFKNGNEDFFDYDRFGRMLSSEWISSCSAYGGLYANVLFAQKWFDHCCNLSPVEDWCSSASYLASYTSKNKTYQNIIPDGWHGLRFTNKSLRNYGDILKSKPTYKYFITEDTFIVGYRKYEDNCKKQYGVLYNERKFKKNGFWIKDAHGYIVANHMGVPQMGR